MNSKVISIIFACFLFETSSLSLAETTARQTISATLGPVFSVTNVSNSTLVVNINNDGRLSSNLTPSFKFSSNSPNGTTATFSVQVNTAEGAPMNALYGTNNSSTGKILLSNANSLPSTASVKNALSQTPSVVNNPNVISYSVTFKSENTAVGVSPKFGITGTSANSKVLKKNGSNIVSVIVNKDFVENDTFGKNDMPGVYQAIIFCTTSAL